MKKSNEAITTKKYIPYLDTLALITILTLFFGLLGSKMGIGNMFSSLMETAYKLLLETVLYIMAIAVLAGSISKLFMEFGVVNILNKIFSPLMRPLYNMPGVAFLGIITTYLSDNPAIIALAEDKEYLKYYEEYEIPCLCNLGTSFGMGFIVTTFMIGLKGTGFFKAALVGNLAAVIGSIVSVRLMQIRVKKSMNIQVKNVNKKIDKKADLSDSFISRNNGSFFERFLTALLDGGKFGVDVGLSIIPGVLIICTIVMMLTFGPADPSVGYQGKAFEGVAVLPYIGEKLSFILKPLFGFHSPEAIAFPITALGAVGSALSLVPKFLEEGLIGANEIAVFTAMGMCWSGYLSTHVAMMDILGYRKFTSKAIGSHAIGGLVAGIVAHLIMLLIS